MTVRAKVGGEFTHLSKAQASQIPWPGICLVLPGLQPVTGPCGTCTETHLSAREGARGRVFCRVGGTARARPSLRALVGAAGLGPRFPGKADSGRGAPAGAAGEQDCACLGPRCRMPRS